MAQRHRLALLSLLGAANEVLAPCGVVIGLKDERLAMRVLRSVLRSTEWQNPRHGARALRTVFGWAAPPPPGHPCRCVCHRTREDDQPILMLAMECFPCGGSGWVSPE